MWALLSPRLWIALAISAALAFTHFAAYRSGKANIRAQWDAAKVVQQAQAAEATRINHAVESARQTKVIEAQNAAQTRNRKLQADALAARSERDRLRDQIATIRSGLPTNTASANASIADTANELLGECGAAYQELAAKADGHASDAMMLLQAWPK